MITPEQYGAKGDGTTDDTAAMQLAFNAATTGKIVQLAPATYRITSALTVHQELTIRGTGHLSVIAYDGPPDGCALSFSSRHAGRISDLMIRGTVGTGMRFDNAYDWTLDNLAINGFDIGVAFVNTSANNLLLHPQLRNCRVGVLANSPTNAIRDGAIVNCDTGIQSRPGANSAGAMIVDAVGFSLGNWHIDLTSPGEGWVIRGCWMENSQLGNIRLGDGSFGPFGAVIGSNVLHTYGVANIELNGGASYARIHDNSLSGPGRIKIAPGHVGAILRDNIAFPSGANVDA